MELAIFREYLHLSAPHLLDKTGVYVVQPNSLQRSLRNVHKIGKGQLQERFRMYKQMWPDGGKVFAFFTVPTPTAVWSTARDIPSLREQQLIGVGTAVSGSTLTCGALLARCRRCTIRVKGSSTFAMKLQFMQ